jgi:transcriptional/translational regulatory protein YebC/TACO1
MTRDTNDRAIAGGAGTCEADDMEELTYEGTLQVVWRC